MYHFTSTVLLTSKSICKAVLHVPFHICACIHIEKDRQLSIALDWPMYIGNWWVIIHSLHGAATTYASSRHVQYGVTYWLHTARQVEFTNLESLNMTLWFAWILEYSFRGQFTICTWTNFWFGGIYTIKRWCLNCW